MAGPRISLIVPSRNRPVALARFLDALRDQLCAADEFEVVIAFDGPTTDCGPRLPRDLPFEVTRLERAPLGISAAKNAAVAASRGTIVLLVNDDIVPEARFVAEHLAAHDAGHPIVLGDTPWSRDARDTVFDGMIRRTPMVFFYGDMISGQHYGFRHAWNLNLSVDRALLMRLDGPFADGLRPVYYDDVEMAYRLMGEACHVFYHAAARAVHEHRLTPYDYFFREALLGVMAVALHAVNPTCFAAIFRMSLAALCDQAEAVLALDVADGRRTLSRWLERVRVLSGGEVAPDLCSMLYDAHLPLKRRAFRCGVRCGVANEAAPWTARFDLARRALAGDPVFAEAAWAGEVPCG